MGFWGWEALEELWPDGFCTHDLFGDSACAVVDRDLITGLDAWVEHARYGGFRRLFVDDDFEDVLVRHFDFEVVWNIVLVVPVSHLFDMGWDDSLASDFGVGLDGRALVSIGLVEEPQERFEAHVRDEAPDQG